MNKPKECLVEELAEPEPLKIHPDDLENNVLFVQELCENDSRLSAPINIDVTGTTRIDLPLLEWHNYETMPKKMKLTNTGHTLILSAKWNGPRPYLAGGPLQDSYVLSQLHFHWGASAVDGSEHTIDEVRQPLELHAIHFKQSYRTQSLARTKPDGLLCVCYLFQIRSNHSEFVNPIVSALHAVRQADTQVAIQPFVLTRLLYPFEYDYYLYWGRCGAATLLWLISRNKPSLSFEQLCLFRQLLDTSLRPIVRNWREVNARGDRMLLYANAVTEFTNTTLAPVPLQLDVEREILCPREGDAKELVECRLRKAKWFRQHVGDVHAAVD